MQRLILLTLFAVASIATHAAAQDDQSKCINDGSEFAKSWQNEHEVGSHNGDMVFEKAEFHFNKRLNTCLVYTSLTAGEKKDTSIWRRRVLTDIHAHRVLSFTNSSTEKSDGFEIILPTPGLKAVDDAIFSAIKIGYFSE